MCLNNCYAPSTLSQDHHVLLMASNLQGVVTYASPVEVFATGIKMEPSDQSSFLEPIKGSRRILSDKYQPHFHRYYGGVATFCPLNSCKIKQSRALEWSDQNDFHRSKFLIVVANASTGDGVCDYPLLNLSTSTSCLGAKCCPLIG